MSNLLRQLVSKNRKRLVDGKFNLDLTYINERIIAMGYPSDKPIENLIRNNIKQVSEYLNEKHENSYKIFNLCLESDYDFSYFNNMVIKIEIEDHNPPRFDQILQFCSSKEKELLLSKTLNFMVPHFYIIWKILKNPIVGRPIVAGHNWILTPASKFDFIFVI